MPTNRLGLEATPGIDFVRSRPYRFYPVLHFKSKTCSVLLAAAFALQLIGDESAPVALGDRFGKEVRPFLETYCFECHGLGKQKGKLDLGKYASAADVAADSAKWKTVLDMLASSEMPPDDAKLQPTSGERNAIATWANAMLRKEAERTAGDPGDVLARRLSSSEYDYTIRDLTGFDIRPAREFPVDPANEAGFDNSGESLSMSPGLLQKYLAAAREVAEHVVLKPNGFVFAPHPMVTEPDRDKYCVKRIVEFYKEQPTDLADYFRVAWLFQNRAAFNRPNATLTEFARENSVSAKYLLTLWRVLSQEGDAVGPIAALQAMWHALPSPNEEGAGAIRSGCEQMRDLAIRIRTRLRPEISNLGIPGISNGSQPLVLWKDRQYATNRMRYPGGGLKVQWVAPSPPEGASSSDGGNSNPPVFPSIPPAASQALNIPETETARTDYERGFELFCRIFPDAFYVSERGRIFLKEEEQNRGRLLSAGFHLMAGYFRDDEPLRELILDEHGRRELEQLWQELDFITWAPMRQYKDFIFFERAEPPRFMQGAEFDFARSEDKDSTSEAKINRLAEAYLSKARQRPGDSLAIGAIEYFFRTISPQIRWVEESRRAAEPSHLESLLAFAARAYRRPLRSDEQDDLVAYYRSLREHDHLGHEDAIREVIVSVLMSPYFCYRMDLSGS
ncbi:MAG: DUF1587 domain-containing protein [Verrucomicrobia bacterium]|nr:DUF1587 domain-containing protein [Verrucomicrobiota bacterium]